MTDLDNYTPVERVLMLVSSIVAQSQVILMAAAKGEQHPLGVYQNEYGRVVQIGKPQRKTLAGMILTGDTLQPLTDAFVAARETPEGQALLQKIASLQKEAADIQDQPGLENVQPAGESH